MTSWQEEVAKSLRQRPSEMRVWLNQVQDQKAKLYGERKKRMNEVRAGLLAVLEDKLVKGNLGPDFLVNLGAREDLLAICMVKETPFCFFLDVNDRCRLVFRAKRSMQELACLAKKAGYDSRMVEEMMLEFDMEEEVDVEEFLRALATGLAR